MHQFAFLSTVQRIPFPPHPLQHVINICVIFDDAHSDRCEAHCGLICIFLMISNVEHFFKCLKSFYNKILPIFDSQYGCNLLIFIFYTPIYCATTLIKIFIYVCTTITATTLITCSLSQLNHPSHYFVSVLKTAFSAISLFWLTLTPRKVTCLSLGEN